MPHKTIEVRDARVTASVVHGPGFAYAGTAKYPMGVTHYFDVTEFPGIGMTVWPKDLPGSVKAEIERRVRSNPLYAPLSQLNQ